MCTPALRESVTLEVSERRSETITIQAALRRRRAAASRSHVACRFIQILLVVSSACARSNAASAVTPRLPRIDSLTRARVQPIRAAKAA